MQSHPSPSAHVCTPATDTEKIEVAAKAINHLMRRIALSAEVAYYFDPLTESFDLLVKAHSLLTGQPNEKIRGHLVSLMRYAPPTCRKCGGAA